MVETRLRLVCLLQRLMEHICVNPLTVSCLLCICIFGSVPILAEAVPKQSVLNNRAVSYGGPVQSTKGSHANGDTEGVHRRWKAGFLQPRVKRAATTKHLHNSHGNRVARSATSATEAPSVTPAESGTNLYSTYSEEPLSLTRSGDLILGALFPLHKQAKERGSGVRCGQIWEQYGIHRVEAFSQAVKNVNEQILSKIGINLGFTIRDSCWSTPVAMEQCINFVVPSILRTYRSPDHSNSGVLTAVNATDSQPCSLGYEPPIVALIGPGSSRVSAQTQGTLQVFRIPQVGYSATAIDLSDTVRYRYFLRVVPSDSHQARALADFVASNGWTYVSALHSGGDYGLGGIEKFIEAAKERGICIATKAHAEANDKLDIFRGIVRQLMETPTARVVICFCEGSFVNLLFQAMEAENVSDHFTVIGSDGWNDRPDVVRGVQKAATGGFSIKLHSPPLDWFDKHFLSLTPETNTENPWFKEFWETRFNCRFSGSLLRNSTICTGNEDLSDGYVADSKLGFVINAVQTVALALVEMHSAVCGSTHQGMCAGLESFNGSQFYEHLKRVEFVTYSNFTIAFDERGDPPGESTNSSRIDPVWYEFMNYQKGVNPNGKAEYKYAKVGTWKLQRLKVDRDMFQWSPLPADDVAPKSFCSEPCRFGYAMKISEVSPCCWHCEKCTPKQHLSGNGSGCIACSTGEKPNFNLTGCIPINVDSISWTDVDAALPAALASFGLLATFGTTVVFMQNHNTPVSKASTRELGYIVLAGISLALSSTFAFIVHPTDVACYARRALPGIGFAMIYSSLLMKTNRIARILAQGKKTIRTGHLRFMSVPALVGMSLGVVVVEVIVVVATIVMQPPEAVIIYPTEVTSVKECNSDIFTILGPLALDFLLVTLCTFYAIRTRNVPENFNEAKFVGFAMYTTCVIWIAFTPIYFGGESKVLTIATCIDLSALVALIFLFMPKMYVMLVTPEKNIRLSFTTCKHIRCHVGRSVTEENTSGETEFRSSNLLSANYHFPEVTAADGDSPVLTLRRRTKSAYVPSSKERRPRVNFDVRNNHSLSAATVPSLPKSVSCQTDASDCTMQTTLSPSSYNEDISQNTGRVVTLSPQYQDKTSLSSSSQMARDNFFKDSEGDERSNLFPRVGSSPAAYLRPHSLTLFSNTPNHGELKRANTGGNEHHSNTKCSLLPGTYSNVLAEKHIETFEISKEQPYGGNPSTEVVGNTSCSLKKKDDFEITSLEGNPHTKVTRCNGHSSKSQEPGSSPPFCVSHVLPAQFLADNEHFVRPTCESVISYRAPPGNPSEPHVSQKDVLSTFKPICNREPVVADRRHSLLRRARSASPVPHAYTDFTSDVICNNRFHDYESSSFTTTESDCEQATSSTTHSKQGSFRNRDSFRGRDHHGKSSLLDSVSLQGLNTLNREVDSVDQLQSLLERRGVVFSTSIILQSSDV